MTIEEYSMIDKQFNQSEFISYANNVFIKVFTSIMFDNTNIIKHFVNDNVYNYIYNIANDAKTSGYRQMYDELNVSDTRIVSIDELEDRYEINLILDTKYMDYLLNLKDSNDIKGNNTSRSLNRYSLIFTKLKEAINSGNTINCTNCGNKVFINDNGICEYCRKEYELEKVGFVLTSLERV